MPRPTPFHPRTSELCTSLRWKDWAGYAAVCSFDHSHVPEYFALRNATGLIDVTPLFKYEVQGPGAGELLARVHARDPRRLADDQVAYTLWCNDDGNVVDDGTVLRLDETHYRMTAAEPSGGWLREHARGLDVEVRESTDELACLAVQGPTSRQALAAVCDADLDALRFFRATAARFDGFEGRITRTGYTGDLGYEVWVAADDALALYDALLAQAPRFGVEPVGLDALDMARIEAGFVLLDVDYFSSRGAAIENRKCDPYELGLGWLVQLDREPFVGQRALRERAAREPAVRFVGLEVDVEEIEEMFDAVGLAPELPYAACRLSVPIYAGGRQVGYSTSRTFSPVLKRYLALGWVTAEFATPGSEVQIEVTVEHRRRSAAARVVATPFFDPPRKRATPSAPRPAPAEVAP